MNGLEGVTPAKVARAFRTLDVATDGKDFDSAAKSVCRHIAYHAPDAECRETYDLAAALGRFNVYVPGKSFDETAAKVIEYVNS